MLEKAINSLVENAKFTTKNNKILKWFDDRIQPTQKQIDTEIKKLEQEYKDTQYQRDRLSDYSKLNQDELRFDDLENNTTTWQDAINAIKVKYPKPV